MQTPLNKTTEPVSTPIGNIEELTITIAAKNLNPTMLSADFLKFSGIVPSEWELAKQPVSTPRGSEVNFKNGVNIIAQPGSISFVEAIANKDIKTLQFAQVAQSYVKQFEKAEYQGLSISPKIIVPFPEGGEEGGKKFISEKLIAHGPWTEFGKKPPQAALNLFYELDQCQLALNINPARLQQPDKEAISAVLFAGNFTYNFTQIVGEERITKLCQTINNWDQDLEIFRELVYEKFLQKAIPQQESLFS